MINGDVKKMKGSEINMRRNESKRPGISKKTKESNGVEKIYSDVDSIILQADGHIEFIRKNKIIGTDKVDYLNAKNVNYINRYDLGKDATLILSFGFPAICKIEMHSHTKTPLRKTPLREANCNLDEEWLKTIYALKILEKLEPGIAEFIETYTVKTIQELKRCLKSFDKKRV